jgi:hypothetical protein
MLKIAKVAALAAIAGVLCGFNDADLIFGLNAHRGEPVRDAIARLGPPVHRSYSHGKSLYYWRSASQGGDMNCKIWGTARRGVITNWGYQDCAF